jgi:hypothetical protein
MSFQYKNPISGTLLNGPDSVVLDNPQGTNFSVLSIGGYMEVYSHQDLIYDPIGPGGSVTNSANTIPINLTIGTNNTFNPAYVTLNSDNISSGRRRLGMLVYVNETDQVYQFNISNYEVLWNAATAETTSTVIGDYTTTISSRTTAGRNFINVWKSLSTVRVYVYTVSIPNI